MMASITHCLKNQRPNWRAWLLAFVLCSVAHGVVRAAGVMPGTPELKFERIEGGLWLSASLHLELPGVVEDALLKGIPIHFVAEAEVLRERWYWINRKLSSVRRSLRLAYHPLTRRWRLNVTEGDVSEPAQGLSLNQSFDSVQEAMTAVQRVSRWRVADVADVEPGGKHIVVFRFWLDVAQLPRPLQIGTLGQSDWQISLQTAQALPEEGSK